MAPRLRAEARAPAELVAADVAAVDGVVHAAFAGAPHSDGTEPALVAALRRNPTAFVPELALVACVDEPGELRTSGGEGAVELGEDTLVGYVLFTRAHIVRADGDLVSTLALAPLAVHPAYQRRGIGGELVLHGHDVARRQGHASVVVLGNPAYYSRFGFRSAASFGILPPVALNVPPETFMAVELVPGALSGCAGRVRYAPEFGLQ